MKDSIDPGIDLLGQQDSKQENHFKMNVSNPEPEPEPMTDANDNQLVVRTFLLNYSFLRLKYVDIFISTVFL